MNSKLKLSLILIIFEFLINQHLNIFKFEKCKYEKTIRKKETT